jgi:hypothetical protein
VRTDLRFFLVLFQSTNIGKGINVSLAFCMGKDLQGILDSPIDQPMATVGPFPLQRIKMLTRSGHACRYSSTLLVKMGPWPCGLLLFLCSTSLFDFMILQFSLVCLNLSRYAIGAGIVFISSSTPNYVLKLTCSNSLLLVHDR